MRTELTCRDDKLYINVEGMVNLSHMDRMKEKIDHIVADYHVQEIELNHEKAIGCSKKYWESFMEPYRDQNMNLVKREKRPL